MQRELLLFAERTRKRFPALQRSRRSKQKPKLRKLPGIKIVLTDLYGTVFIANQLPKSRQYKQLMLKGFRETAEYFGLRECLKKIDSGKKPAVLLKEMLFSEIEKEHSLKKRRGKKSPEVKIEEMWQNVFRKFYALNRKTPGRAMPLIAAKAAYLSAWMFEPTGIHSGFLETAQKLKERGIKLGIASNAQFYSKINLDLGLREKSRGRIKKWQQVFDQGFCAFSFELGESKPSKKIFKKIIRNAKREGIGRKEIAFVGNDLFKDIKVGKMQGFKTVLFAGDAKSLQLRKGDRRAKGVKPDAVITEWGQLLRVVG